MAPWSSWFTLAHIALIVSLLSAQDVRYTCPAGSDCLVDCENTPNVTCNTNGNGRVIIDAESARSLDLYCYEPDACADMVVECPITSAPSSFCVTHCDLGNSCNSLEIHTH